MIKSLLLIILLILTNCSFDNKTGIWKNKNSKLISKQEDRFKDFKKLYTEDESFEEIIEPSDDLDISVSKTKINLKWPDEFYKDSNNLDNFSYKNLNRVIFKSKKLSQYKVNEKILFDGENIIINDEKGNIIIYSVEKQEVVYKYNFYKKRYKKLKKNLNIIIEDGVIYVSDNIGYFYSLNYKNKKLLWAKNYKIPFRSNIKIFENKIILADQNNVSYLINKSNGDRLKIIPTENVKLKNEFINSLALLDDSFFFLNTYGSLYSINNKDHRIQWFTNFNQSIDLNSSNLFYSNPILLNDNKILVSTDPYLYVLNSNNGTVISKNSITSIVKPIISGKGVFLITKDNLLVYKKLNSKKIIYSINIPEKVANYLDTKKKSISVKSLFIVNNDLFIFLENSYLLQFSKEGKIKKINKLPDQLGTSPIFINNSIIYLNKKNRLIILD